MLPAEHAETLNRVERGARYLWASQAARGRVTLDVGCRDGVGTSVLSAAGAGPVVGVDPSPEAVEAARREFGEVASFEVEEPMALPYRERRFDLVTCFGVLEGAPEPEAVLDGIERAMSPNGLLLASLPAEGPQGDLARALRARFGHVALHEQAWYAGSGIGGMEASGVAVTLTGQEGEQPHSVVAAASAAELPSMEAKLGVEEITGLNALVDAVSRWEERARGAEAEVAAMRWEVRIAGEKLTALVQRLLELENAPARRLRRRLGGGPARYSPEEVAEPPRSPSSS